MSRIRTPDLRRRVGSGRAAASDSGNMQAVAGSLYKLLYLKITFGLNIRIYLASTACYWPKNNTKVRPRVREALKVLSGGEYPALVRAEQRICVGLMETTTTSGAGGKAVSSYPTLGLLNRSIMLKSDPFL